MALHESFISHQRHRWFQISLALVLICVALYVWHDPVARPNGGTWLGYTLGTIGALLIVWLALLGVRKRSYASNLGTLKGWTSAHVWLGLALIIIATLHSGFQFGWNIHTLAWVLMLLVILSGVWGVVAYLRYPTQITAKRGNLAAADLLREIVDLDKQLLSLAAELDRETHERTIRSIQRTQIGGSFWQQVRGIRHRRMPGEGLMQRLRDELNKPAFAQAEPKMAATPASHSANATVMFMASAIVAGAKTENHRERQRKLLDVMAKKKALVKALNDDITRRARMTVWLYFHVPLTVALLMALSAHILSVFLYW